MDNDSYVSELADLIRAKLDPNALPDKGLDELFNMYAVLGLAKGEAVTREDVHDAWSAWATKFDPDNDSLVPFEELPPQKQDEDTRFMEAIRQAVRESEDGQK